MVAIVPVYIGSPAVIICMQKLMGQGMVDLLLADQMIMTQDHLHSSHESMTHYTAYALHDTLAVRSSHVTLLERSKHLLIVAQTDLPHQEV